MESSGLFMEWFRSEFQQFNRVWLTFWRGLHSYNDSVYNDKDGRCGSYCFCWSFHLHVRIMALPSQTLRNMIYHQRWDLKIRRRNTVLLTDVDFSVPQNHSVRILWFRKMYYTVGMEQCKSLQTIKLVLKRIKLALVWRYLLFHSTNHIER